MTLHGSVAGQRLGAVLAAVGLCLALSSPSDALETDQYYAWGRPLADSTAAVNAKFNLELQRAIDSFGAPPEACVDIAIRFRKRMRFVLFHHIQIWGMNTALAERVPGDGEEYVDYRSQSMYRIHGPLDTATWMPMTPTIEVNGVRIGTDKLSHLVSSGWTYYTVYSKARGDGAAPIEAEETAVRRGILEERLILGSAASGILSIGDLEASLEGMYFYLDLCGGENPILQYGEDGWSIGRPIDMASYVHPGWDESYRPSIFSPRRWMHVSEALKQYCDLRDDPQVIAMLERYRMRDRRTTVQEAISEMVADGRLPDPSQFRLDAVCEAPPDPAPGPPPDPPPTAPPSARELTEAIVAEEQMVERRLIPIAALRVSYPQIVSLSYGALVTRQPTGYDCRTPCDFWGGFGQLEPGIGGGKLSLGWGRVIGEQRRGRPFLSSAYLGLAGKATVLRTWGSSSPLPENQTYAGAEAEISIAKVNMGLGVLGRVSGDDGRDWVVTGHLGWGF